ncbi:MAG: tetratricopeptide repeat protein [Synechococcus sp.]|nr:tetratricopeptide repeat protein [Synechococcus sp.]
MKPHQRQHNQPSRGFNAKPRDNQNLLLNTKEAIALRNTANSLYRHKQIEQSQKIYEQLINTKHVDFLDYCHLATLHFNQNNTQQGIVLLKQALSINPDNLAALYNISKALKSTNKLDEANHYCSKALNKNPDNFEINTLYANILKKQNRITEAHSFYLKAYQLNPNKAESHWNLGNSYESLKNHHEALKSYAKTVKIQPNNAKAWTKIGQISKDKGHALRSTEFFLKALELEPDNADLHLRLMFAFGDSNQTDKALLHAEKALAIQPKNTISRLACSPLLQRTCSFSYSPQETRDCIEELLNSDDPECIKFLGIYPLESLHHDSCLEDHLRYLKNVKSINQKRSLNFEIQSKFNLDDQLNQLSHLLNQQTFSPNLGFISGDFREHVVMRFLPPLLKELKAKGIKVSLFDSCELNTDDSKKNEDAKKHIHSYHNAHDLSTNELLALIQKQNIDILIDLSGHTRRNRLDIFNQRAASLQLTWLGYPASSGAEHMDFILIDKYLENELLKTICSETPVAKKGPFLCMETMSQHPITKQLPEETNQFITFGTLNNPRKYTKDAIKTWSDTLKRVNNSKLLIARSELSCTKVQENLMREFNSNGISKDQIIFRDQSLHGSSTFLETYNEIDIALDTFPYTGTTTTLDTIWMGVPVITLSGISIHQRASASILHHCKLDQFICQTQEQYVKVASKIANNRPLRQQMRHSLRSTLLQSAIFQPEIFTQDFLESLKEMVSMRLQQLQLQTSNDIKIT